MNSHDEIEADPLIPVRNPEPALRFCEPPIHDVSRELRWLAEDAVGEQLPLTAVRIASLGESVARGERTASAAALAAGMEAMHCSSAVRQAGAETPAGRQLAAAEVLLIRAAAVLYVAAGLLGDDVLCRRENCLHMRCHPHVCPERSIDGGRE